MAHIRPQPRVLVKWRVTLALFMLFPAFLNALFFPVAGKIWIILTVCWVALFLAGYLLYLPLRYKNLRFSVEQDRILLYSGVLYTRVRCMPIGRIQYVAVHRSPADYLVGLCTLAVTAAGARLFLPGLREQDAEALARSLIDR